jgi:hypothetical protein
MVLVLKTRSPTWAHRRPLGGAGGSGKWDAFNDPQIQRRVMEARRNGRDGRLWIVALVAIGSALSAAVAWYADFHL